MTILFAFISHNSFGDLIELVSSLDRTLEDTELSPSSISLLLIENSTRRYTDTEFDAIQSRTISTSIIYIDNQGYNHALNHALHIARNQKFDYLVAGNPDVSFASDYLSHLELCLRSYDFHIAVPNVLNLPLFTPQNPRVVYFNSKAWKRKMALYFSTPIFFQLLKIFSHLKSFISLLRTFYNNSFNRLLFVDHPVESTSYFIDVPCGVQFIFDISRLPSDFLLDENLFLWGEELMLYLNLKKLGLRCRFFSSPTLFHKPSSSVSSLSLKYYFIQRRSFAYILAKLNEAS